jgi:cobalt-zinc-cadmium efflux system outer membrane protein
MPKLTSILPTLVLAAFSAAAQPLATNLTPETAVATALQNNRDLAAARFAIRQAEGRLKQAGLWPNPEFGIGQQADTAFENEGENNFSTGFRQRFPITGRLSKGKAVARVDVAQAVAEVRNQERLLAGDVLARARELLVLQQQLQANQEIQDTIGKLATVSDQRAKVAEVSQADVNLARLELQKAQLARQLLLNRQEVATTAFNQLLGREPKTPLELSGELPAQVPPGVDGDTLQEALARRPDRQLAALSINRAAAELKLARAEKWEDWSVGFDYSRDDQSFKGTSIGHKVDQFLGLSVSIPLPLWNRNQGNIAVAQATQQRAGGELAALDLRIATEVRTAGDRLRRLADILRQYRDESLKLSEQNVALTQKGYSDGLIGVTAVIQAQQQFIELRLNYLDTLAEFERALTDWQTATASIPLNPIEK